MIEDWRDCKFNWKMCSQIEELFNILSLHHMEVSILFDPFSGWGYSCVCQKKKKKKRTLLGVKHDVCTTVVSQSLNLGLYIFTKTTEHKLQ